MDRTRVHDGLNRMVKMALDTGEVTSIEEAHELFATYRIHVSLGRDVADSATLQAAALTAINTGRRCFLGGVSVSGPMERPLVVPWRNSRTLGDAILDLQGRVVAEAPRDVPILVLGDTTTPTRHSPLVLRATFNGWTGAVAPLEGTRLDERSDFTPAGVLAGALAVSEVFQHVRGTNVVAGRRETGLSLWTPEEGFRTAKLGPSAEQLPSRLWLIGLGHLGQAVLWTLGLLRYANPRLVELVLQDIDELVKANDSTSLLTTTKQVGQRKTRAMAKWCEQRGFRTHVMERLFDANFTVAPDEPGVAVCGVDNPNARAVLEDVGFSRVVEAGLGAGPSEYLAFQVHSFPAGGSAKARWGKGAGTDSPMALLEQPAYQNLQRDGLDECGLVQLAGRTVGAPFVGAVTAALVTAELVRMAQGLHRYELVDGSLRMPESLTAFRAPLCSPYNPGTAPAHT